MRKSILFLVVATFIMMLSSCGAVCDVIMYNGYDYPRYEYRAPYRIYRYDYPRYEYRTSYRMYNYDNCSRTVYIVPRTVYIPIDNRPRYYYNDRSFGNGIRQNRTFGNGRFGGRR